MHLDDSALESIRAQLALDVDAPEELPDDTYFGGKALYRLANLLQIATQLGEDDAAEIARTRLVDALTDWTTADRCETESTRCFVYDPEAKGIVGKVASFGSDEFNDHHFHYGYLLYAAAIAVKDDPSLQQRLQPVMDLVAADLATDGGSSFFPDQRAFDAYAGHSWASGYVPFRDGNNQESSSEAVAAWNGLALWADVTGNDPLADEARWMLANEAATAQAYWVGFDQEQSVYDGYDHSIVALNWGSKRDYATWFSAEPAAKLGIQLIPMSPASAYLVGRCRAHHGEPRRGCGAGLRRAVRRLPAHVRGPAGFGCRRRCAHAGSGRPGVADRRRQLAQPTCWRSWRARPRGSPFPPPLC